MRMGVVVIGMLLAATLYGAATGQMEAVSAALLSGAGQGVELTLAMAGALALWSGFLELLEQSGLASGLQRLCAPLLGKLFPVAWRDEACARALAENVSSNLLGLGNAATPAGIRAAERLDTLPGAETELARLVVMNTASLQLLPTTVAALRAANGAQSAFDILPCVWITSLCSVSAGLLCVRALERRP